MVEPRRPWKGQSAVIGERRDGDGGRVSEGPGPGGPRRPRPVPAPTRDKETADA